MGSLNDRLQRRSKWSSTRGYRLMVPTSSQVRASVLASLLLLLLFSQVLRYVFLIKTALLGLRKCSVATVHVV